jgi:signal transduction histidine kinase/AraC-like DNA-binding protein/DNA-binding LacI/PurR family transcriptional regulator
MPHNLRVGLAIHLETPYWVQVREASYNRAAQLPLDLVAISLADSPETLSEEEQVALLEELLALELDALIAWALPDELAYRVLQFSVPIVLLSETEVHHPLLVSPLGRDVMQMGIHYLAERLTGQKHILILGGPPREGQLGKDHTALTPFPDYPHVILKHIPIPWLDNYEKIYQQLHKTMPQVDGPIDAIFGLSDALALAGRDAGRTLGLIDQGTAIVGVGGTPVALAAIADGSLMATVEIRADELGKQAIDLAHLAAQGQALPAHFEYETRLVSAENVAEIAAQELSAMASLYDRMMNTRRQQQQQQLTQLETSLEISRRVGSILDRHQLPHEIANLIRANYGYDRVQIFHWLEQEQCLVLDQPGQADRVSIPLVGSGVLGQALMRNEAIFIPDTHLSPRFSPDPNWPDTRTRVVLPIRMGGQVVGLLDLHSRQSTLRARQELVGLQSLADQLGIAMSNADLYSKALEARADAEKADQLKTRLLANVSHELRTPLNTILGFVKPVLDSPSPDEVRLSLLSDLQHVYHSAEHLLWVINDLLDLSRAEIDELNLHLEIIEPQSFLKQVFHSVADSASSEGDIEWRLRLPDRLPLIQADPVRLRQILLNLLSNARKFTEMGQIVLGAEVIPPHLHIWVQDTGVGIPADWQERIFEPFVTAERARTERAAQRPEGIGLGLSITRRLVTLHRGSMTLESQHGQGSTFHIYLPLPSLSEQPATPLLISAQPVLLLVSAHSQPTAEIAAFSERQRLEIRRLQAGENPETALEKATPVAIAWDLASATPADWATVQRLRHHPQLCQVPFILYGQAQSDHPDLALGLTNLVTKPVSDETLLDAINVLCLPHSVGPILIVDDDPQALELYQGIVKRGLTGYPVRTAEDGTVALAMMSEETPCLVILDLMMPEMDGFEVLDWMRANQQTRRVPVLVLSGRMLTLDDIKRLERHALVTLQSKDILSEDETANALHRILVGTDTLPSQTSGLVKRTLLYLQQNYDSPLSRREMANAIGVSESHLSRIFRRELGITPWDYLNRYRIKLAKELLVQTDRSITSVALEVGFSDPAYFSRVFRRQVGLSPSAFREQPNTN